MSTSSSKQKRRPLWIVACWECGRDFLSHRCTAMLGSAKCRQRWTRKKRAAWAAHRPIVRHPRAELFIRPRPYAAEATVIHPDHRHK